MVSTKIKNKVLNEVLNDLRGQNPLIDLVMVLAEREDIMLNYSEEGKLEVIEKWRELA